MSTPTVTPQQPNRPSAPVGGGGVAPARGADKTYTPPQGKDTNLRFQPSSEGSSGTIKGSQAKGNDVNLSYNAKSYKGGFDWKQGKDGNVTGTLTPNNPAMKPDAIRLNPTDYPRINVNGQKMDWAKNSQMYAPVGAREAKQ